VALVTQIQGLLQGTADNQFLVAHMKHVLSPKGVLAQQL
jgi:hypothetical protein